MRSSSAASLPSEVVRARWAVFGFFVLAGFAFSAWAVRIPDVKARIGLSEAQLGLALLGSAAGSIVAMSGTGFLIARFGSRAVTGFAGLMSCLALPLLPQATSGPLLFAALFVFGGFFGMMDVAMNTQAVVVEERYHRPIMSAFHGVFSVGALAGSALAAAVAGLGISAQWHLFWTGLALIPLALLSWSALISNRANESGADGPAFALPTGPLAGIALISFCVLLSEGAVADWSSVYLRDNLGAAAALGGLGYAAFSVTMAIGRFAGDAIIQRLGPVSVIRWGGVFVAGGLGLALLIDTTPALIFGFACVGMGLAAAFPIALSAAGRAPGVPQGTALAAVATSGYFGFLVGAPTIGLVSHVADLRTGLAIVALLGVVMVLLAPAARLAEAGGHATPTAEAASGIAG
ncbi:MAG: MFS transporter [Chloroflexota bacterium]